MKTSELLSLDMEKNKPVFQKALKRLPFGEKWPTGDIPFKVLEKYVSEISLKGKISLFSVFPTYIPGERTIYTGNAFNRPKLAYPKVYGSSIYEVFVKLCILFYVEDKK